MYGRREFVALVGAAGAASLPGCQRLGLPGSRRPRLHVPSETAVGGPFRVEVSGVPEGSAVAVEVTARDARDVPFGASFDAVVGEDATAVVTSAVEAGASEQDDGPTAATRTDSSAAERVSAGIEAAGPPRMPLAGMEPASADPPSRQFVANGERRTLDRIEVTVSLDVDGTSREAPTARTLVDDGLAELEVPADSLVGRVHEPEADGPHPGVLVLHGSFARVPRRFARMLASNGFSVLALRYFGGPGLPSTLDDVPLEYFDRAVSYLLDRDGVFDGRVGLVGISRGVEAALLTAAAFEGRTAVVGYSGSGLALPGIDASGGIAGYEAAWTRDGEAIVPAEPVERILPAIPSGATTAGALDAALDELAYYEETARVGVPVEDVDGPVLLLSGQRDAIWNAPVLSEYAAARLAERDHGYPFAHVTYGGAGHVFVEPYLDARLVTGARFGGSVPGTARAAADGFVRCLDYLRRGLVAE